MSHTFTNRMNPFLSASEQIAFEEYVRGSALVEGGATITVLGAERARNGGIAVTWRREAGGCLAERTTDFDSYFGIPDDLNEVHWEACGLDCPVILGERCRRNVGETCTGPKFSSAAAEILWVWSISSGEDEKCGHSEYGNGWHALFRDERAILHVNSQGFVTAWRIPNNEDLDAAWAEIEKDAVYPDDECENGSPTCSDDEPCVLCHDEAKGI